MLLFFVVLVQQPQLYILVLGCSISYQLSDVDVD